MNGCDTNYVDIESNVRISGFTRDSPGRIIDAIDTLISRLLFRLLFFLFSLVSEVQLNDL